MSLRPLYEALKTEVEAHTVKGNKCSVIVDDYSILLSLGLPLSHLVDFIHYLRVLLCTDTTNVCVYEGTSFTYLSFIRADILLMKIINSFIC